MPRLSRPCTTIRRADCQEYGLLAIRPHDDGYWQSLLSSPGQTLRGATRGRSQGNVPVQRSRRATVSCAQRSHAAPRRGPPGRRRRRDMHGTRRAETGGADAQPRGSRRPSAGGAGELRVHRPRRRRGGARRAAAAAEGNTAAAHRLGDALPDGALVRRASQAGHRAWGQGRQLGAAVPADRAAAACAERMWARANWSTDPLRSGPRAEPGPRANMLAGYQAGVRERHGCSCHSARSYRRPSAAHVCGRRSWPVDGTIEEQVIHPQPVVGCAHLWMRPYQRLRLAQPGQADLRIENTAADDDARLTTGAETWLR